MKTKNMKRITFYERLLTNYYEINDNNGFPVRVYPELHDGNIIIDERMLNDINAIIKWLEQENIKHKVIEFLAHFENSEPEYRKTIIIDNNNFRGF